MRQALIFVVAFCFNNHISGQSPFDSLFRLSQERLDKCFQQHLIDDLRVTKDSGTLAEALHVLGVIEFKLNGLSDSAVLWTSEAMNIRFALDSIPTKKKLHTARNLLSFYYHRKDWQNLKTHCEKVLQIKCENCDDIQYQAFLNLARSLINLGDFQQAALVLERWFIDPSPRPLRQFEMAMLQLQILSTTGVDSNSMIVNRVLELIELNAERLSSLEKTKFISESYNHVGFHFLSRQDYERALLYFKKALSHSEGFASLSAQGVTVVDAQQASIRTYKSNVAYVMTHLEDFDAAKKLLNEVHDELNTMNGDLSKLERTALFDNFGFLHENRGDLRKAIQSYKKALNNTLVLTRVFFAGEDHTDEWISNAEKRKIMIYLSNLSRSYCNYFFESGKLAYADSAKICANSIANLSTILLEDATARINRRHWQAEATKAYHLMVNLGYKLEDVDLMIRFSEMSKNLLARSTLRLNAHLKNDRALSSKIFKLDKLIVDLEKAIFEEDDPEERSSFIDSLRLNRSLRLELLSGQLESNFILDDGLANLKRHAQGLLSDQDMLLNYSWTENGLYCTSITNEDVSIYSLEGSVIEQLMRTSGFRDLSDVDAEKLYHLLLEPISDKKRNLIISPDAALNYLNFEMLINEDDIRLMKSHVISYTYSIRMLDLQRSMKVELKEILAFAPGFNTPVGLPHTHWRNGLSELIFSELEVNEAVELIRGEALSGRDANLGAFESEAPNYGILHLATHAVVNDDNVDFSCIYFQPEEEDSLANRLYLNDLYAMHLPLEMVVLSACETGVGELLKGEGMLSLANGFTQAGAKSVITSLWKADDESTYKIMTAFYKYLARGQRKDEALRNAKLEYLENCDPLKSSPFYWAAFIPIGDMSPIRPVPFHLRWWFWPCIFVAAGTFGAYVYRSMQLSRAA